MSKLIVSEIQMSGVMGVAFAEVTPDGSGVVSFDHKLASVLVLPDASDLRGINLTDDGTLWEPTAGSDHSLMLRATSTFATVHVEDAGVTSVDRIVSLGSPQSSFRIGPNPVQVAYDVGLARWRVPDWAGFGTPVGSMVAYAPAAGVPPGYLECDGSLVSRATYALLFLAIGETYGAGDGSTTFELPTAVATPARWMIYAAV